jgi:hypothetical protein
MINVFKYINRFTLKTEKIITYFALFYIVLMIVVSYVKINQLSLDSQMDANAQFEQNSNELIVSEIIKDFKIDIVKNNINVDATIGFKIINDNYVFSEDIIGSCMYFNGKRMFVIKQEYFKQTMSEMDSNAIKEIIYHELGHCILHLAHTENPKDLMAVNFDQNNLKDHFISKNNFNNEVFSKIIKDYKESKNIRSIPKILLQIISYNPMFSIMNGCQQMTNQVIEQGLIIYEYVEYKNSQPFNNNPKQIILSIIIGFIFLLSLYNILIKIVSKMIGLSIDQ